MAVRNRLKFQELYGTNSDSTVCQFRLPAHVDALCPTDGYGVRRVPEKILGVPREGLGEHEQPDNTIYVSFAD